MTVREFTTVATFDVTGRGTAHVIYVGVIPPELGDQIMLDGAVCTVAGVEWPLRVGHTAVIVSD